MAMQTAGSIVSAGSLQATSNTPLQIGLITGFDHHPAALHPLLSDKTPGPTQSTMDEILEQMLSLPPWPEPFTTNSKAPWDYFNGVSIGSHKLFTMASSASNALLHNGSEESNSSKMALDNSQAVAGVARSPISSSGSEASCGLPLLQDTQLSSPGSQTWHEAFMPKVLSPPLEGKTVNNAQFVKRPREDDTVQTMSQDSLFIQFGGVKAGQVPTLRGTSQQHQHQQALQGISVASHACQTGLSENQGTGAVNSGAVKPRVRARRGQATDPHSIAERLRRERIGDRMKELQELVPNGNKTDKASMLDEIIEYVKFLQLQVKVLSMSRLGGTGAVAPLIADIPSEDHNNGKFQNVAGIPSSDPMVVTERQVARLMEHDMGSAMQYLQSKGLCLMPISLATAISTTKTRMQSNVQGGVQFLSTNGELDALTATGMTNSSNAVACAIPVSSAVTCTNVTLSDSTSRGGNGS